MLHMGKGVLSDFAPVYSPGRRRKKYVMMIMLHTHCVSASLVARATTATFRSTTMGTGFTRLGGDPDSCSSEVGNVGGCHLSVLPVTGVVKPQCREHLANRLYGILSRAGSYWTAGWGDVPSTVVPGKGVEDGDRLFITNK